jgi:glycosyltransferase involved in cell wall biosynthesis
LKIIAILVNNLSVGGGFAQSLNAIVQMKNLSKNAFEFSVLTSNENNLKVLEGLKIDSLYLRLSLIDKLFATLVLTEIGYKFISKFKLLSSFEKRLKSEGCNLVYFLSPSSTMSLIQSINYISTVWDSSHRDSPEFDEVRSHGEFRTREYIYKNYLSQALVTLVDAEESKENLHNRYGLDKDKMLVMPFSPNPLFLKTDKTEQQKILKKYNIETGYLFYPAQFWSHKNHIRVLQAIKILKEKKENIKIVFSGGIQQTTSGYYNKVLNYIENEKLQNEVSILGFVPSKDMSGLYSQCSAVVFPSYLGPTNIPPLEAWYHNKPLLCSELHAEQVGNAAILFNPDNSADIAKSILQIKNEKIVQNLLLESRKQIQLISKQREHSEVILKNKLNLFKLRFD